jgi:hypothetical protein
MTDLAGSGPKKMMNKKMAGLLPNAPFIFAPGNGLAFFEDLCRRVVEAESLLTAARRFHRLSISMRLVALLPRPDPRHPVGRPWNAVALLTR